MAVGKSTILLVFQGLKKQRSEGFGLLNTASPIRNAEKDAKSVRRKKMRAIKLLSAKEAAGNSFANGSTINGATKVLCTHTGGTAGIISVYNAAGTVGSTCNLLAAGSGDAQIILAKKSTDVMSANQGSIEFTACLTEG